MSDVTYYRGDIFITGGGEGEGDDTPEIQVEIGMKCVTPGAAPQLSGPPENCDPGWPAEFECESIRLLLGDKETPLVLTQEQFRSMFGKELADKIEEDACGCAGENYES